MPNTFNLKLAITLLIVLAAIGLSFFIKSNPKSGNKSIDEGLSPRPEVIKWIETNYGKEHKKKVALNRLAEVDQYILTHPEEFMEAERRDALALACYEVAFPSTSEQLDGIAPYEALSA